MRDVLSNKNFFGTCSITEEANFLMAQVDKAQPLTIERDGCFFYGASKSISAYNKTGISIAYTAICVPF